MNFLVLTQQAYRDAFKKKCSQHFVLSLKYFRPSNWFIVGWLCVRASLFPHVESLVFLCAKWLLFMNIKKITKTKVLQLFFSLHSLCVLFSFLLTWNGPATPVLQDFFFKFFEKMSWMGYSREKKFDPLLCNRLCACVGPKGTREWPSNCLMFQYVRD